MAEASETSRGAERVLNPLWIISLFLGLAEVTVGVAATQAHGWIQGMLATFSVVFPSAVAAAFFGVLLTRPFVLYAPKDYPNAPSIEAYVTAVSSTAGRNLQNVEAAVRTAVEEVVVPRLPPAEREVSEALVEAAVRAARTDFQRRSVEVDISGIDPKGPVKVLTFPMESMTVSKFLDAIYLAVQDELEAYSYGRQWLLHEPATGKTFTEIGTAWWKSQGFNPKDNRSLREIGIEEGTRLVAVRADR
ncbi:hypothetical protein ACH4E7_39660 [Kitasatospora sp. NPDC018058]|uniref:hypothetical protein n=1 Tax=Kitasatospora sp. NPDC018058 TaxID=3364025 RepID=UPI0037C1B289